MNVIVHSGDLPKPIAILENIFEKSGLSLIQAAFKYSYFLSPEKVRNKPVFFPNFARTSREHYPGKERKNDTEWKGRKIRLSGNTKAQEAWKRYSGRSMERKSGYGVRHVWGHPWDPDAYTAGWNLCYMLFWAGMLTEDQHPHPMLSKAIQQASFNLFFDKSPVCALPDFVQNPGLDLKTILGDQPLQILQS